MLVTQVRVNLFGNIKDGEIEVNKLSEIVQSLKQVEAGLPEHIKFALALRDSHRCGFFNGIRLCL